MTIDDNSFELAPELLHLTRREQKYAIPFNQKWVAIFNTDRPNMFEDNQRRALNGAYATAAKYWLMPAVIFALPASLLWSFFFVFAIIFTTIGGVFFCIAIIRICQAFKFYPHFSMVRLRLTAKHPDKYS